MIAESIDRALFEAGLDAVRQIGGDALVGILLTQSGKPELGDRTRSHRVTLEDYLAYRDTAVEFLRESFCATAFETGRILGRRLRRDHKSELDLLLTAFDRGRDRLPIIGQAAVLGARGNPGQVRASMAGDALIVTIDACPECRGLKRDSPFCYLNQGLITELAEGFLGIRVSTLETKCIAMGNRECEVQVRHAT